MQIAVKERDNQRDNQTLVTPKAPGNLEKSKSSEHKKIIEPKPSLLHWFYNLPIRQKQLLGLFTSEVISIVGLVGVGAVLLVIGGRSQLLNQAKSELKVKEINYNIKIDQIAISSQSHAENQLIINAATSKQSSPELRTILFREIWKHKIEFATLVDSKSKIIATANLPRSGINFDPNGLVTRALNSREQIRATELISYEELAAESPRFAELRTRDLGLDPATNKPDFLIRYIVTPVKKANSEIVGAIIAGDLVKSPIVADTINSLNGGYSAVYLRRDSGDFVLAASQLQDSKNKELLNNLEIANNNLLKQAVAAQGDAVAGSAQIASQNYTTAAKALSNNAGEPIAILVRGTPRTGLNRLLGQSLLVQMIIAALALAADVFLAIMLSKTIAQPLQKLTRTAREFSERDRAARTDIKAKDEIGELARTFNQLADNIVKGEMALARDGKQTELLAIISCGRTVQEVEISLNQLLQLIRDPLKLDRVVIYRFNSDRSSHILAEAREPLFPSAIGVEIPASAISMELYSIYKKSLAVATNNILEEDFPIEYRTLMEKLQVKSHLVAPILQGENLLGLLVAHQCDSIHYWQQWEIDEFVKFAGKLAVALNSFVLLEQKQVEAERERQEKEILQAELYQLLGEVEQASVGDLTVRADMTDSAIGIVADFFNSIIENLQDIVIKVKKSASEVNTLVGHNEAEISQLAHRATDQSQQIKTALNSVEKMTGEISNVARNAKAAATIATVASTKAETGKETINRTVASIVQLRTTVEETGKKVKRLAKSSQQISKVVALINQIALQTNLLAINASIEATRAGEKGLGFAVVAEEVGQLASQSAAATKEIEIIVENIQGETQEVIKAMKVGTAEVVTGTSLVEEAKENFSDILKVSQEIDKLVQSISKMTVSQAETSEAVKQLMRDIAAISASTSESSCEVSGSLGETVTIARQLQESVSTFKVEK